jgi:hypothetical protein
VPGTEPAHRFDAADHQVWLDAAGLRDRVTCWSPAAPTADACTTALDARLNSLRIISLHST